MAKNWLLVANRTGARIFENTGPGSGLSKVMELNHPEGRLKDQDFVSDKPGRGFDSGGEGSRKKEMPESPSDHENRLFAHDIASTLTRALEKQRFTRLYLIAEAGYLGDLKSALDKKTTSLLEATLTKDLVNVKDRDIPEHLGDLIKL